MEKKISLSGYKISLLSVTPGNKERVVNKLSEAIMTGTSNEPIVMLKIFGRYDICAIYKTDDFLAGPSKLGSIDGIRGGNQIFAFPYPNYGKKKILLNHANSPIWGFLFFRTNQSLTKKYGYSIEEVLSDIPKSGFPTGITLDVLGTTGWAELVFIVRGNKFASVAKTLSQISQTIIGIVKDDDNITNNLFSAKTFSIIGVDYQYLSSACVHKLPTLFDENYNKNSIHPILSVTCSPGDMKKVFDYCKDQMGHCYTTFGGRDFLIYPDKCKTWGVLLETLLKMRKTLEGNIYSTSLEILCPASRSNFEDYPSDFEINKGIDVNSSLLTLFHKWGPYFQSRLLNLYFGISNLIQDPLVGECFEDLRKAAIYHLPEALENLSPDDIDHRKIVWEIMEALSYGAEERANGAFLAIENNENRFSPTKGGIQRILKASQLLPNYILNKIDLSWNGFVIAGFQNLGFAECGEIINLPLEYLFHPEEWWGLFHEIGHVALWKTEFINLLEDEQIKSQLNTIVADPKLESKRTGWKNLFMEIAADSFDLFFCHEDIDIYLRNIWPYITKTANKLEPEHYGRYFCMFQYWQYIITRNKMSFPKRIDLHSDLNNFVEHLKKLGITVNTDADYDQEAIDIYRATWPVMEICHKTYQDRKRIIIKNEGAPSENTKVVINKVMKGRVVTEILSHPDKFILALKEKSIKRPLSIDIRIAAILSLWNTSKIQT